MDVTVHHIRRISLVGGLLLAAVGAASAAPTRVALGEREVATLTEEQEIFLEAVPEPGEGLLRFSRRLCGSSSHAAQIAAANGGSKRLLAGVRYRVPLALLPAERQLEIFRRLFDQDQVASDGWRHRVTNPSGAESLWRVAEWFTGRGENYPEIREHNRFGDNHLDRGQIVVIPARLLRPALRAALPRSSDFFLEYDRDAAGEVAVYRLKAGEALYSSVVIRFTGRIFADDVRALAVEIAARSGIRDVTDIPVGYRVKIPLDALLPEFLPAGHPRRAEYEQGLLASSRFSNPVRADRLQGVWVVLDSGHGGSDVGASMDGVWESLYVYDIMVRARRLLESTTAARVVPVVRDGASFEVAERDVLPFSRGHRVLTTPDYPIEDSTVGLHLRWYLANSVFRRARSEGVDPARVVFLSIHADSLHESLRGAMAYIPGAGYRTGSYSRSGSVYAARKEYREKPQVSFSSHERTRSEGLSRELAGRIVEAFARHRLPVHPDKPIREKVIRQRRAWVPAVLRYNAVPAQMLLEVCNLANAADRKLLQTRSYRQQVAQAIVDGIVDYYGDGDGEGGVRVAAGGG